MLTQIGKKNIYIYFFTLCPSDYGNFTQDKLFTFFSDLADIFYWEQQIFGLEKNHIHHPHSV